MISAFHAFDDQTIIEMAERSLEACIRGGFRWQEAQVLLDLGRSWRDLGEHDRALGFFQRGIDHLDGLGDTHGLALSRLGVAVAHSRRGHVTRALEDLAYSERYFRAQASNMSLMVTLLLSCEVAFEAGRLEDIARWLHDIEQLEPVGNRLVEFHMLRTRYAYEADQPEAFLEALESLKEHSRILGLGPFERLVIGFEALWLDSQDKPRESLALLDPMGADSEFGHHWTLANLEIGELEAARRGAETFRAWTLEQHQQVMFWVSDIVSSLVVLADAPTGGEERQRALLQLESVKQEARHHGAISTSLEAALALAEAKGDRDLLRSIHDEAEQLGLDRLARQAAAIEASP